MCDPQNHKMTEPQKYRQKVKCVAHTWLKNSNEYFLTLKLNVDDQNMLDSKQFNFKQAFHVHIKFLKHSVGETCGKF